MASGEVSSDDFQVVGLCQVAPTTWLMAAERLMQCRHV